jgi:hypothetical protein
MTATGGFWDAKIGVHTGPGKAWSMQYLSARGGSGGAGSGKFRQQM